MFFFYIMVKSFERLGREIRAERIDRRNFRYRTCDQLAQDRRRAAYVAEEKRKRDAKFKAELERRWAETEAKYCPDHRPDNPSMRYWKDDCPVCDAQSVPVPTDAEIDAVVNEATALLLAGTDASVVAQFMSTRLPVSEERAREILLSLIANTGLTSDNITSKTVANTGGNA